MENATNVMLDRTRRNDKLIIALIRKLRANPHWFEDTCVILGEAGVTAVQDVRGTDIWYLVYGTL